jgi:hypothetical protein
MCTATRRRSGAALAVGRRTPRGLGAMSAWLVSASERGSDRRGEPPTSANPIPTAAMTPASAVAAIGRASLRPAATLPAGASRTSCTAPASSPQKRFASKAPASAESGSAAIAPFPSGPSHALGPKGTSSFLGPNQSRGMRTTLLASPDPERPPFVRLSSEPTRLQTFFVEVGQTVLPLRYSTLELDPICLN